LFKAIFKDIKYIIRDVNMITGAQIRAARSALKWSAGRLSEVSGVSVPTVQRFEQVDGVPPSRSSTLIDVQKALEAAGIEFIGNPDDGPGIRLRKK
jgi:DNA-binding transcriptional regulator YiaG